MHCLQDARPRPPKGEDSDTGQAKEQGPEKTNVHIDKPFPRRLRSTTYLFSLTITGQPATSSSKYDRILPEGCFGGLQRREGCGGRDPRPRIEIAEMTIREPLE
jgi:hypothetical protein